MQFSVFILLSALLSLAFAAPIPGPPPFKAAVGAVTAVARLASKAPKTPVRSQTLPARLFPGAIVNTRPIDVKNLPILPGKNGNPNPGAQVYHPSIVTGKRKDGSGYDVVPISHTPVHPSKDVTTLVNHPHLDGQAHLGHDTHIDEKDIRAATGGRAGGKVSGCEVLGLCNERLANDPRPKPVRTQSLPPPKLEHHDNEEHNPEGKTHRKSDSS